MSRVHKSCPEGLYVTCTIIVMIIIKTTMIIIKLSAAEVEFKRG